MAGIGFRLNRLLQSDDVLSKFGGVLASALLSSGPWLATIVSIATISLWMPGGGDPIEKQIFRVIINYTYAFSLISFSAFEMTTTRYLADLIYLRQDRVIPTLFTRMVSVALGISGLIGILFYSVAGLDWQISTIGVSLLCLVTLIWCCMIFLSACKDYVHISLSFVLGAVFGVASAWILGTFFSPRMSSHLLGFTMGQAFTAMALVYQIYREFGWGFLEPRDFISHMNKHRMLILVGLFYSLSIWVDKIIFWIVQPTSEKVAPYFYKSSAYDTATFLAYLTIIPALAYFMVRTETSYYLHYRRYFSFIDHKAPLDVVEKERSRIISSVQRSMVELLVLQGVVTLSSLFFASHLIQFLKLPAIYTTVFKYGLIAAPLHVFMLFCNILILYLDLPRKACVNYLIFFIFSAVLSFVSTQLDYRYHGLGYLIASLIALIFSVVSLRDAFSKMNYYIFMKQLLTDTEEIAVNIEERGKR